MSMCNECTTKSLKKIKIRQHLMTKARRDLMRKVTHLLSPAYNVLSQPWHFSGIQFTERRDYGSVPWSGMIRLLGTPPPKSRQILNRADRIPTRANPRRLSPSLLILPLQRGTLKEKVIETLTQSVVDDHQISYAQGFLWWNIIIKEIPRNRS